MTYRIRRCPICNDESREPLYSTRDRHYGIVGDFQLARCAGCGLIHLDPMYSDEELALLYPKDYYSYQPRALGKRYQIREFLKSFAGMRIHTKDPHFDRPGRVLDIGCGSGWFLEEMRSEGWEVHGIEINADAVAVCKERALNVHAGTIFDADLPEGYFDYVRLNHSFEHMTRPRETLQSIRRLLNANGRLLIGVPNEDSTNSRFFQKYWWYRGVPVHPYTYSTGNLKAFLENNGFSCMRVTYNSDWGGTLGSLQIFLNRNSSRLSTEGILIGNGFLRFIAQRIAKLLDLLGKGDAIEIIAQRVG